MTTEITKQEMIDKIYEVIADKTVSFGCLYKGINHHTEIFGEGEYTSRRQGINHTEEQFFEKYTKHTKIIGHPVMIGDVLDRIEKKKLEFSQVVIGDKIHHSNNNGEILFLRQEKRKPIEDQSEECIRFIYNLCK